MKNMFVTVEILPDRGISSKAKFESELIGMERAVDEQVSCFVQ